MTTVKTAEGVDDSDDWSLKLLISVPHRLKKRFANVYAKLGVAVVRQAFSHSC
jgi:hypothetical protein